MSNNCFPRTDYFRHRSLVLLLSLTSPKLKRQKSSPQKFPTMSVFEANFDENSSGYSMSGSYNGASSSSRPNEAFREPSVRENQSINNSDTSPTIHTLRSSRQYQVKSIPQHSLQALYRFTLTSHQYYRYVNVTEHPGGRFIYLDNGKVCFDTWTMPPHAEVITEIIEQIALQNRNPKLFQSGTGGSMFLVILRG